MGTVTWAWDNGKPSLSGVGQEYDVYSLYLFARHHGRLPKGLNFAGLVWVALDAQGLIDLDVQVAARQIAEQSWGIRSYQQVLDLLLSDDLPHLTRTDWMRLCNILDLPVSLMEVAVVTIEE